MDSLKGADNPAGKPYTSRYIGSLVCALGRMLITLESTACVLQCQFCATRQ